MSCFSITRVASSIKFTLRVLDTKGTWKVEMFTKEDPDSSKFDMENRHRETNFFKKKRKQGTRLPELWMILHVEPFFPPFFHLAFGFSSKGRTVREARTLHSITFTARTELLEPSWHFGFPNKGSVGNWWI